MGPLNYYRYDIILRVLVKTVFTRQRQFLHAGAARLRFAGIMASDAGSKDSWKSASSIYEFSATGIDGNEVSLENYRGHVCIIFNVACKCGFTSNNYTQLQEMYKELSESKGLRILAFPCNQFAGQEPGTEEEIKKFAIDNYGVTFDMFAKIDVNGDKAHPLWKYLKHKQGGTLGDFVKWNFTKFVIDKNGQPVARYAPNAEPKSFKKDLDKYW